MEIICEHCKTRLSISDEKIPKGQRTTISCPKCRNKLVLKAPSTRETNLAPGVGGNAGTGVGDADSDLGFGDDDSSLDFFEEGAKMALLMGVDAQQVEKLGNTVGELGYRHVTAKNTRDAISKMRLHHFDVIFLSDQFDEMDLSQSPILQHINNLSMSVRRRIFLGLIADHFKTMDHMMAFAMSANLVVNGRELDRLTAVLKHAISDNEKFYKVFMETMEEVGKA
jgi:predicted Zn finger-like uncharacterized protein